MKLRNKIHQCTEAELIKGLKNDSVRAFNAIYDMYFGRLYSYCFQFAKSHKDAEDMVQEIFIKLWISRHDVLAQDSLRGLLFRIARNRLISAYRANINSPRYEEYLKYRDSIGVEDYLPMEYEEFLARVEACISKLPYTQQRVVRMSKFDHIPVGEIALELGIGEQSVRNQLSMALKSLRKMMGVFYIILLNLV